MLRSCGCAHGADGPCCTELGFAVWIRPRAELSTHSSWSERQAGLVDQAVSAGLLILKRLLAGGGREGVSKFVFKEGAWRKLKGVLVPHASSARKIEPRHPVIQSFNQKNDSKCIYIICDKYSGIYRSRWRLDFQMLVGRNFYMSRLPPKWLASFGFLCKTARSAFFRSRQLETFKCPTFHFGLCIGQGPERWSITLPWQLGVEVQNHTPLPENTCDWLRQDSGRASEPPSEEHPSCYTQTCSCRIQVGPSGSSRMVDTTSGFRLSFCCVV